MENLQADVVIVGGGGSGMVAAVSAAENGAGNVIVLEKAAHTGGNAFLAVAMFAVESPVQKRLGFKTSREQFFKEAMAAAKWTINPEVVRAYVNKSGELVGWFESKGIKFGIGRGLKADNPPLGHEFSERQGRYAATPMRVAQGPGMVGSTVIETMLKDCDKLGIKVLTKTKAEKLLTDTRGSIKGVLASSSKGKNYKISTKSVVIAAGDFGGNAAMMSKYFGLDIHGDVFHHAIAGQTGDGIVMAGDAGALIDKRYSIHWFGPCHHKWAGSVHYTMQRPDMLWVNKNGERFMDEFSNGMQSVYALNVQPGKVSYSLLDSNTLRDIKESPPPERPSFDQHHMFDTLYDDIENEASEEKKAWKADTLEELAMLLGAKPAVLKATVARYNAFCDKGHDDDFIKDPKYLKPIRKPPYYAILGVIGYGYTSGGIKINERMEVISKKGGIISGLYAAGNNAGDWTTQNYAQGGTSLTFAFCSGYIAGESAAKYVLGKS